MSKSKKLSKKVEKIIRSDIFAAIAIASLFLNLFLLTGFVLFNSTNRLDEAVYEEAYTNLCRDNYNVNLQERMENSADPQLEKIRFDVYCRTGAFTEYFSEASNQYTEDAGY